MATPLAPVFSVRRCPPELVAPARLTPHEIKPLSDLDNQGSLRVHIPGTIFYRSNPSTNGRCPAKVVREALAAALVLYYPLAGRLVEGPDGKLAVDCTAEGVLFMEADADVTIDELGDAILPPCPNLDELLFNVPGSDGILGCPVLLFQVTRLRCGGFILASRLNHTMCDAFGFVQFLKAVGEIARGAHAPSVLPVWQREIFNARQPPHITCKHHEFDEIVHENDPPVNVGDGSMVQRSFFFSLIDMNALRSQLPMHLLSSSIFEVLAALLWQCRTIALDLHPDQIVRLSCMVSARGNGLIRVPPGYYGNAFVYPAVASKSKLVCKNSLAYVVEMVKNAKAQATEEYVRSVVDFMAMKGPPMYTPTSMYMVSDTRNVASGDVDFGWGKPLYNGPAVAIDIVSFCVRYKNIKGEDGVAVPICLPRPILENFGEALKKIMQGL